MDKKWYFFFMTLGFLLIAMSPLYSNEYSLIISGIIIVILSFVFYKKSLKVSNK